MSCPITAVTVLEDRAAITRRGSYPLAAGQHRLAIEQVAPVLADKTLTAVATGARVLDARCERYLAADLADPDLAALRSERAELATTRDLAGGELAAARSELAAIGELARAALGELAVAASRGEAPDTAREALAGLDALDAAARARAIDADAHHRDLGAILARLDERIARAEATTGRQAARLIVDLLVEREGEVALQLDYVVPGAAWRPYHRAVLSRASAQIEWQTTACVWQATGEDWDGVALTCSLERPSLGVAPPALVDDELRSRRRPDVVAVEAREQELHTTGLGGGPGQSGATDVPGIDDGGLGVTLSAPRATVRSDGAPHRIPIGGFAGAVQLALVAVPLRSPWVHLRVRVVNTSGAPLLAGPVDLIMASGYIGRAEVGFVAAGEKFHVGFGPEADLRVHRSEARERDDAGLLGGWNVQTVRVAVRLSNLGGERREVRITERIPISEVEQVDVQVAGPDAYLLGTDDQPGGEEITQVTARTLDEHGMMTWTVELPPLGRRAVTLEYRVRSQRSVAGV